MRASCVVVTALALLTLGCGGKQRQNLLAGLPAPADAPYELSDDDDLDTLRGRFDVLEPGAERRALRQRLVREYARRLERHLQGDHRHRAYAAFQRLAGLFSPAELTSAEPARVLRAHQSSIQQIRDTFARSGGDHQASGALAVLQVIDPANRSRYTAELEEIFDYSDALNVSEYGEGAQHARPIEILEGVAAFFPSPWVVDHLVARYVARQKVIDSRLRRGGADFNLIRAHGAGVLRSAWHLVAVLAKADRLREAVVAIDRIVGVGDDPELRVLLRRAVSPTASPRDWLALSRRFVDNKEEKSDPEAQLAVLRAGLRAHPGAAILHLAAGKVAFELERVPLAVEHLERGLALERDHRPSSERLAALYENQVITLALGARVKAATQALERFEKFHARAQKVFPKPLKPDLADAYAAMGQGLVSLGDQDRARRYLERSVSVRPTYAALEILGLIELKRGGGSQALSYFERALALPITGSREQFRHGKILRLAGEAALAAGDRDAASRSFARAMSHWGALIAKYELSDELLADLMVETGKLNLASQQRDTAFVAFEAALGKSGDSEYVVADVVAQLVGAGEYRRALDVYHRGLESAEISDELKVYMSLWMLAESGYRGLEPDPFVSEFIRSRTGSSWQDVLARYAAGDIGLARARAEATTRRRRSELIFYSAVIFEVRRNPARARALLDEVASGSMILDFEFDLARRWRDRQAFRGTDE